jgi:hypothetical protein
MILLSPAAGLAQVPLCTVLDSVARTIERISCYRLQVDRSLLMDSLAAVCAKADSLVDLAPGFSMVIDALGDHHGRVYLDGRPIAWLTDGTRSHRKDDRAPDMEFWIAVLNGRFGFESRLIDGATGYLRIPAVNSSDVMAEAIRMRRGLDSLITLGARQWVIDLRVNSGGNMWPMLEALAPLFPEGIFSGAVDRDGKHFADHGFRDGHFERQGYRMIELPVGKDRSGDPIVVLFGRYTASAGEVVALCFDQRPGTMSMGEATAGYITETGWTLLYDRLVVSVSESMLCRLDGKPLSGHLAPKVVVPDKAPSFDANDAALNAAVDHLLTPR